MVEKTPRARAFSRVWTDIYLRLTVFRVDTSISTHLYSPPHLYSQGVRIDYKERWPTATSPRGCVASGRAYFIWYQALYGTGPFRL